MEPDQGDDDLDPMTSAEAHRLLVHAHEGKHAYGEAAARHVADRVRAGGSMGRLVAPYRCPFASLTGGDHWHIGRVPAHATVERIALAIRWFHEHPPDDNPDT